MQTPSSPSANDAAPSSPTESPSTMTPPSDMMEIFIKTISGETIPLTVSTSATVADLRSAISTHPSLPSGTVRLLFNSRSLTDSTAPLSSTYAVQPSSTINLAQPTRPATSSTAKLSKLKLPRCEHKRHTPDKCSKPVERIVGDCGFCGGHFCSKHRLLESHNCEGLEDCKKESHERNADKLNSERTRAIKGI